MHKSRGSSLSICSRPKLKFLTSPSTYPILPLPMLVDYGNHKPYLLLITMQDNITITFIHLTISSVASR